MKPTDRGKMSTYLPTSTLTCNVIISLSNPQNTRGKHAYRMEWRDQAFVLVCIFKHVLELYEYEDTATRMRRQFILLDQASRIAAASVSG